MAAKKKNAKIRKKLFTSIQRVCKNVVFTFCNTLSYFTYILSRDKKQNILAKQADTNIYLPMWKKVYNKLHLWLQIIVDGLQLIVYSRLKRCVMSASHYLQSFYKSLADKPEDAWLKPVAGAHLSTVKSSSNIIFYIILTLFIVFFIWANVFEIDEYVHAQGKIEPESEVKTLSHFEGGVVQNILVKEGDRVEENQILLQLKDVSSKATYDESLQKYYFHWAQILRLNAQINQKPLVLPKEIENYSSRIVRETKERYNNRIASCKNEEEIGSEQLNASKSELEELLKKTKNLENLFKLSTERTMLLEELVEKNLIARTQLIQSKIDTANRTMEFESARDNIFKLKARVQEAHNKLEQVKLRYDSQDWQELKEQELKFQEAKKMIAEGKDKFERTNIRSPVHGIVKELFIRTIGAAVTVGKELVSIVPIEDTLLVEVYVSPQDIGFIHKGEEARVKITAYDYSIYGSLDGIVEHVSADALQDPKDAQHSYYRVRIRTKKNTIDYKGKSYSLMPGETVQADIITGQRTIMQYMLKPIIKTLADPLRER